MTGLPPAEQRVVDLVDVDDVVGLTQRFVRAEGQNPPGEEAATAAEVAAVCRERGLAVAETPVTPGRPNLSAVLPGGDGPGLLLLGHTDVVPVGDGWTVDPFGAQLRDGRVYGRGSSDMKGGLAASIAAMDTLRRAGVTLSGPVELAALVDEEETGLGIRHFVESGDRTRFAGCIVAEPTDLQTIIAARGDSYVDITVRGRAAHSGRPGDGRNAIYGAAAVIASLQQWHAELDADRHPLVGSPTWSVGLVSGGQSTSIVPAECRISADRRLMPQESAATVLGAVRARIAALRLDEEDLDVQITMPMDMPGFETAPDDPFVTATDTALSLAGGPGLPLGGWTAACDGGFIAAAGVPTVVLGPGSVNDQAHRADESVEVDQLLVAAWAYAVAALRLLS